MTGNTSGPHTHAEWNYSGNANAFKPAMAARGITSLRRGGSIKYDNTLVNAHEGETILSRRITKQFEDNLLNSTGGRQMSVDNINLHFNDKPSPENARRHALAIKKHLDEEESRYHG